MKTQAETYLQQLERALHCVVSFRKELCLDRVVLYGSMARCSLSGFSDIDILLVLDVPRNKLREYESKAEKLFPEELVASSPELEFHFMTKRVYDSYTPVSKGDAFYQFWKNIREEGVCLWERK